MQRWQGDDRYATAAAISRATFAPNVPVVFVATGEYFADALAGAPAAAVGGGPILLVTRDIVPSATDTELRRLAPQRIVVLGGAAAVSDAVVAQLASDAPGGATRVAGASRYETSAAVSAATFSPGVGVAYVATGDAFADALPGGAVAGAEHAPVLLVTADAIPASVAAELRRLQPRNINILGGFAAVSYAVEQQLHAYTGGAVNRVGGNDRYGTAVDLSTGAYKSPPVPTVFVATGLAFPDGLAGGPPAALAPGPVLLVPGTCVPDAVNAEIDRLSPSTLVILGGTTAVSTAVESRTPCPLPPTPPPPPGSEPIPSVTPSTTPAFDDDAPDPDVVRVGSTYYAFTTGTTWGNHIGVLSSDSPRTGWHTITGQPYGSTALGPLPAWQQVDTQTSPGVFAWGGRYVMFYDAVVKANGHYCLTVATSTSPTGPFQDTSSGPFVCQLDQGGSIDPSPFVDTDGRPWLLWKSNDGSSSAVSDVWAAPLADDGVTLAGTPALVMAKDSQDHPWETTVDDPQMLVFDGVHYLFFSGGDWQSPNYVEGYAVCDGVVGPCRQPQAGPILGSYGSVAGPGGASFVRDASGNWFIAYQGWDSTCTSYACGGKRRLYVAALQFNAPG